MMSPAPTSKVMGSFGSSFCGGPARGSPLPRAPLRDATARKEAMGGGEPRAHVDGALFALVVHERGLVLNRHEVP